MTRARCVWIWAVAAAALWAAGTWLVVPRVIAAAHRGESWPFFNAMLAGRDTVPLEEYLSSWYRLSLLGMGAFLLAIGVVSASMRPTAAQRKVIGAMVGGGRSSLSSGELLWLAAVSGVVAGFGEAVYQGLRQLATKRPAADFYVELFWMAPLSAMLASLLLGLLMVAIGRLGRTRWSVAHAAAVLGFPVICAWLMQEGVALNNVGAVLLSGGAASVLARVAGRHSDAVRRLLRGARLPFVGFVAATLLYAWWELPLSVERRASRDLPDAPHGSPNILLIILDTVRATNLGFYGYERDTAPEMAQWARTGVIFDLAVATAPWTLPTHATLLTGRYNAEMETGFDRPLGSQFTTLAEIFSARGYATGAFTANPSYTTAMSGLAQGFHRWEDHVVGPELFFDSSWLARILTHRIHVFERAYMLKNATAVTDQLLTWLDQREGRPFFVLVNYFDAHEPYDSPREFAEYLPLPGEPWDDMTSSWRADPSRTYGEQDMSLWVNRYDNAIKFIDRNVGSIRRYLEHAGLLDNTIVVVTSDHGELFGEHGQIGHAQSLYMPSLHVPLFLSFPGRVPAKRVDRALSLADVPATILDLAGVDSAVPGRSLRLIWMGAGEAAEPSPVLSDLEEDSFNENPWDPVSRGPMQSLIRDELHYIRNGDGVEELYDLAADPDELEDLAGRPDRRGDLRRMRFALDSLLSELRSH